jgi:hypothetical protein
MLTTTLDEQNRIATLEPDGPLSAADFEAAGAVIDPYIDSGGELNGLVIHTETFPGWDSFKALHSHLTFVKEHHKKVPRIAFVTDSKIGDIAESVASHIISAEIRNFDYGEMDKARTWILGD